MELRLLEYIVNYVIIANEKDLLITMKNHCPPSLQKRVQSDTLVWERRVRSANIICVHLFAVRNNKLNV
jgi:hypothetical protein